MSVKDARRCSKRAKNADGARCTQPAVKGTEPPICRMHGAGAPQVKARAAVRAEVAAWRVGVDVKVDPGEILLRLVSQSAARAQHYGLLLEEAYDAAERLKTAHEVEGLIEETAEGENEDASVQVARDDLKRIFTTGGVAALIGNTYGDSKTGGIYATGEAIRGLAKLEAEERDRCANFAKIAIAAGLAERQVRLAEKQIDIMAAALDIALEAAGVPVAERGPAKLAAARHLRAV